MDDALMAVDSDSDDETETEIDVDETELDADEFGLQEMETEPKVEEVLEERVDENVLDFMVGVLERIRRSSGRSVEDFIDLQAVWYDVVNPGPSP